MLTLKLSQKTKNDIDIQMEQAGIEGATLELLLKKFKIQYEEDENVPEFYVRVYDDDPKPAYTFFEEMPQGYFIFKLAKGVYSDR